MKNSHRYIALVLGGLTVTHPASAQRQLRVIPPPDPAIEKASFTVADGFEINLFASDPLIAKPTQISFDRQGRLWVASSRIYPQLKVDQAPSDHIIILEDTDGDGVAEESSIYYDQLIIPGGVLPDDRGGAYVAHAEELVHLTDTNGDGRGDTKQVLLSGFGTEDTHHTLHRLRWGPDGLIYMLQGYYIGTHVETLYGPRRLNGGGLWSYDLATRRLEIYSRGLVNPWGMTFDRWGQTFQTDGAGGEGINYSFPDSVFMASPLEYRTLNGLNPGRPKSCGIEVISGSHFPETWRDSLVTCDFRANNIDRYTLETDAGAYISTLQADLLQSTHVSFRPIDVVMGPDGALYIADWYSPIIQHGEVDFRDERRDQIHGRIWRITAKGRTLIKPVQYESAGLTELLEMLKADEDWVRLNAKQELKTRHPESVLSAIESWLVDLDQSDTEYEHHRLEALWTVQTLGAIHEDLLEQVLTSPIPQARAASVRVLYHWHRRLSNTEAKLARAVEDTHPQVRREAVTALGQLDSTEAVVIALRALERPMDEFLDFALWRTCRLLEDHWLPNFQNGDRKIGDTPEKLAFALKAIEKPEALAPLVNMLRTGGSGADPTLPRVIGKLGTPEDLDVLTKIITTQGHSLMAQSAVGLLEGASDRGIHPTRGSDAALSILFASKDPELLSIAARLAGHWEIDSSLPRLASLLRETSLGRDVQRAAAEGLARLNRRSATEVLAANVGAEQSLTTRLSAATGLVTVDPSRGAEAIATLLEVPLATEDVDELMHVVLTKQGAAEALAAALDGRTISGDSAIQAFRSVEVSGKDTPDLMAALKEAGSVEAEQRMDRHALLDRIAEGDASNGEAIYHRPQLACTVCHRIDGSGGEIGPDLSSIGASAPIDYLVESLIEPSTKIKEGYRMSTIESKYGDFHSGAVVREDNDVVVLRTPAGTETRVPKQSIRKREISPISMMPSGLTSSLDEDEFIDLLKYLSTLGRSGSN